MTSWQSARKILCVRLDALGDVLMTTPALSALKETFDAKLTLLTSHGGAVAAPFIPCIDDTIVYDAPWVKATRPRESSEPDFAFIRMLAEGGFDAAVIFTVYSQNPLPAAMVCYLAGIPLRLAHCRENPYQLLTHWVKDAEANFAAQGNPVRHETERQLDLVASVGAQPSKRNLQFLVPSAAVASIAPILADVRLAHAEILVVHPGASAPSRRYRPGKFAQVVNLIKRRDPAVEVMFTGDASERELVEEIQAAISFPVWNLAGKLSLAELAALIGRSSVLLSNNTGPVHVAAAVGTPVVDLYALTNPQHTPWLVPHRVLFRDVPCRFCYQSVCPERHNGCLQWIPPEEVADAVLSLLAERRAKTPATVATVALCGALQAQRQQCP